MYATNHYETTILGTLLARTAQAPAALYLALFLSDPGETGASGTEVAYTGYARQRVTFSAPAAMNNGIGIQNVGEITFPKTGVSLGSVTHIGVMDSLTGGNMWLYGEFTESVPVQENEAPVIVAGEAQWWLTGDMSAAYKAKTLNLLRGTSMAGFTPCLALYNGSPDAGGAELVGDNYARAQIVFSEPAEQSSGQMRIANASIVQTARAAAGWGTWTYSAIMDAQTAGQPVFYAQRAAKEVRKGLLVQIAQGDLSLSVH